MLLDKKISLVLVAVLAIGIFALPSTIAMFGGQHNWYDLGPSGNDVPCEKCHADVYDEMSNTGPHANMSCWYCHRTGNLTGIIYAVGDGAGSLPGQEAHAASTVECMECHEGFVDNSFTNGSSCSSCHFTTTPVHPVEWLDDTIDCGDCHIGYSGATPHGAELEAGGFNLTVTSSDTGIKAAHKAFVDDSIGEDLMEGANEACITCHTHVAIDIDWSHKYKLYLEADGSSGEDWIVDNFLTEGTYNITTYGNMSGETTGVTDPVVNVVEPTGAFDPNNP